MATTESAETTDVVICGCGPTGALLSVMLGQFGVPHIVLEKEPEITTDPRGIALDEDGIRYLQACGIYDKIFSDIGKCMGEFRFVGGVHHDLSKKPFMVMNYNTTEGGTGHPGFMCHKQPSIEKHLRARMKALPTADLRSKSTLQSIREDGTWAHVSYADGSDKVHHIRSKFVVGADGKTGFTRKQYLEPRGVKLEVASQSHYDEVWVALNWKISIPTPQTHPDFPLWSKGFTPDDVYNAFFPTNFRFLCNPSRPAVCGRFGLDRDRLWRFEFVVLRGEDATEMAGPAKVREIVYPYITHPGSRYGLRDVAEIQYPSDCIEVLRCRPFSFSARSCNMWALDRVILCGDAAHVFPPFGGQGIASGFRDAISLAWRLAVATRYTREGQQQQALDHNKLFEGWYSERKQQLERSLISTVENGTYVTQSNSLKILLRDWSLWFMQLIPSWKHWLELGIRREGLVRYRWEDGKGMAFLPELGGGGNFPQVYCRPLSSNAGLKRPVRFTDDVIFGHGKGGLFQLVVLLSSSEAVQDARAALDGLDTISHGVLHPKEATYIISNTEKRPTGQDLDEHVYRLSTADEFAGDDALCGGRPKPLYYDPHRLFREVERRRFVILRPDRFVFAACNDRLGLVQAAEKAALLFSRGWV